MSTKNYNFILFYLVLMIFPLIKVILSFSINNSAITVEDYDYMNQSPYFLNFDFSASGYPFRKQAAGALYSLVISPWIFFSSNSIQFKIVIFINSILSMFSVLFGSLAVFSATNKFDLRVPIILSIFPPLFLFNFYSMTENLIFLFVSMAIWLITKITEEETCYWSGALFVAVAALAPLSRPPGIAICVAGAVTAILSWNRIPRMKAVLYIAVAPLTTIIFYRLAQYTGETFRSSGTTREGRYLSSLTELFNVHGAMSTILTQFFSQIVYLFTSTAIIPIIFIVAYIIYISYNKLYSRTPAFSMVIFSVLFSALIVVFCLIHLIVKFDLNPGTRFFVYGRYNDPAALSLMICGLSLFLLDFINIPRKYIVSIGVISVGLVLTYFIMTPDFSWGTINQSAFLFIWRYKWPAIAALIIFTTVTFLIKRPLDRSVYFIFAACISVSGIYAGYKVTLNRSLRIDQGIAVANWVELNVPKSACIALDRSVGSQKSAYKNVQNMYLVFTYLVYPRPVTLARPSDMQQKSCNFMLTTPDGTKLDGWQKVWSDKYFVFFERKHLRG